MKSKLKFLFVSIAVFFISFTVLSQDNNNEKNKWGEPSVKASTGRTYSSLPSVNNFNGPAVTTKLYRTPAGDVLVTPNVIPYPTAAANETEVAAVNMGGNMNTMFAAWISYGPLFYGTGFSLTTNGGATWTGSYNNMNPLNNGGSPGPWVWPAGSPWAGRLGISVLNGNYTGVFAMYSTDNGTTWSNGVTLTPDRGADKNLSCVDDVPGSPYFGRAYTLWSNLEYPTPPIFGSFSSDGGVTWVESSGGVSPGVEPLHFCHGVDVQVGPGGVVYAVWACPLLNPPYTEDYLGFAKSTNGGQTWVSQNNLAVNINGIRTLNLYNGFRVNSYPRLAVDKSGGARNGWIYAVLAEKTVAPARDSADVCLCRSTDGGNTWTHTVVNQDAQGNFNWLPAPSVDPNGVLAISYYDTRNTTLPLTQFYMSVSTDGGLTFSDVQVSDHNFTPTPIPGLGVDFDYTGITYGNGQFWPYWFDNSTGHYQVWTAGVSVGVLSHDMSCGPFLSLPASPLFTNTVYNIKTRVTNLGSSNETSVPIRFYVDGVLTNTTNVNENAGAIDSVSNSWQTAVSGAHTLMYIAGLPTDLNRSNDTIRTTLTVTDNFPPLCEQFPSTPFPPAGWSTTGGWWGWSTVSGYGFGTGAAKFIAWNAPQGTDNDLFTITFLDLPNPVLRFDIAYAPFPAVQPYAQDSLSILGSTNGGTSYFTVASLGPLELQTAPGMGSEFTPNASQWSRLSYPLPNGTNRIDFLGRGQFGNDIYIDSVCIDHVIGITSNGNTIPKNYSLSQNYPNPFNPTTVINFGLPKSGSVKLAVYDLLGKIVKSLVNEYKEAGTYKVNFDGTDLASGVYFYRIESGEFSSVKKMLLTK